MFLKINEIHNSEDYTEPLELYIKRYKLNGYDIENNEDFKRFTIIDDTNNYKYKIIKPILFKTKNINDDDFDDKLNILEDIKKQNIYFKKQ